MLTWLPIRFENSTQIFSKGKRKLLEEAIVTHVQLSRETQHNNDWSLHKENNTLKDAIKIVTGVNLYFQCYLLVLRCGSSLLPFRRPNWFKREECLLNSHPLLRERMCPPCLILVSGLIDPTLELNMFKFIPSTKSSFSSSRWEVSPKSRLLDSSVVFDWSTIVQSEAASSVRRISIT